MVWTDLATGILEEFASSQSRYVDATAIQAASLGARVHRLREYRRRWRERNPEAHMASARAAVRDHYWRNREAYKAKNAAAYARRRAA
jgi:hypothetical protein